MWPLKIKFYEHENNELLKEIVGSVNIKIIKGNQKLICFFFQPLQLFANTMYQIDFLKLLN